MVSSSLINLVGVQTQRLRYAMSSYCSMNLFRFKEVIPQALVKAESRYGVEHFLMNSNLTSRIQVEAYSAWQTPVLIPINLNCEYSYHCTIYV